jgi:hypothetical protein
MWVILAQVGVELKGGLNGHSCGFVTAAAFCASLGAGPRPEQKGRDTRPALGQWLNDVHMNIIGRCLNRTLIARRNPEGVIDKSLVFYNTQSGRPPISSTKKLVDRPISWYGHQR